MLRIGQRVVIKNPFGETGKINGTIIGTEIKYIVHHDNGFTFKYEANALTVEKRK